MDDEYYYNDDEYAAEEDEGETWETGLENAYANAKALLESNPEQCISGLRAVERDDPIAGKWTFKALKMLARVSRRTGAYEEMIGYYNRIATFLHPDVAKAARHKAMTKFIDESQRLPLEQLKRVLHITIEVTSADTKAFGKLWFNAKIKFATLLLEENSLEAVLFEMEPVLVWCQEDDQFAFKRNFLLQAYALLLEVYLKQNDHARLRDTFLLAVSITNAIPPSRVAGSVFFCGGHMYMNLHDWDSGFRSFSVSFRNYSETGDKRRIECLKYLILSCMLCGSTIDPFATPETKIYEESPEIMPFAQLIKSFVAKDVSGFLETVERHRDTLNGDPGVESFLSLILEQLRLQALVAYVMPYQRLYMSRLEEVLLVDGGEVERLCLRARMCGLLSATIDDESRVLVMQDQQVSPEAEQLQALNRWSVALLELNERTRREIERVF